MNKKIVVMYDFDGTIINSMKLHGKLAASCMHKHFGMGLEEAEEKYHSTTGVPFPKQLEHIFPDASEKQIKDCVAEYVERKQTEVYGICELFPEVVETLQEIAKMGIMQTIATSTEHAITIDALKKHHIFDQFKHVMAMEQGSKADHIKEIKGLYDPDIIIFIGDSEYDVSLGKIDGVVSIGRFGGQEDGLFPEDVLKSSGANYLVDDLRKIKAIIMALDRQKP
jgi:phosphoglycolate phosphatase-like HAD superfamily hydrolase